MVLEIFAFKVPKRGDFLGRFSYEIPESGNKIYNS